MHRRLAIFAAILALPAAAVILWMLAPAPSPDAGAADAPERSVSRKGTHPSRTTARATESSPDFSKLVRQVDYDFPELPTAAAPALPLSPAPSISPRYTLTTQPDAAALARRLEGQPPLAQDERIRVLPAEVAAAASPETAPSGPVTTGDRPAPTDRAVLLRLDATMHDPAAWVESEKPLGEVQTALKTKVAADFAAEVAAAAKQPENAGKTFDNAWKDARAKANWEYQKFFGGEAANRAALNAGRTAVSKQ